jgi:putative sigma-54 modulation protein
MNQYTPPEIIVSGIHFDLTPSLKAFVQQKAARLFRHEERIIHIRVELEYDYKRPGYGWFVAKGQIASYGAEMSASVSTDECHRAVALLIDKLDRMLHRRATRQKARRHDLAAMDVA